MKKWLPLVGAIVTEVIATLSLKGAIEHPWLYSVVGLGYAAAFTLLSFALRAGLGLGVAYGVWGASGVALTAIFAAVIFGEPLTPLMVAGIGLIMAGVLTIELGSQAAHRRRAAEAGS